MTTKNDGATREGTKAMAVRATSDGGQALEAYELAIEWLADAPNGDLISTSLREVIAEAEPGTTRLAAARDAVRTMALWRIEVDRPGAAAINREALGVVAVGPGSDDPLLILKCHAVAAAFKACSWPSKFGA